MKNILVLTTLILMMLGTMIQADSITLGTHADTYLRDATVRGALDFMDVRGGTYDFGSYMRFDLKSLGAIKITGAQLILINSGTGSANGNIVTGRVALHGLNNVAGNTPQDWDETTLSETGTNPAGAEWTGTVPMNLTTGRLANLDQDDGVAVTESLVKTGTNYWDPGAWTITLSGQAIVDFLQARAYDSGLATFILACDDSNNNGGYGVCTKEHATETWRPRLVLEYTPITTAYLPDPTDGATVPSYWTELSWRNPDPNDPSQPDITSDVYLGLDPNTLTLIADNTLETKVTIPFALSAPNTYYWRVDCTDPNSGLIPGPLWSFTTSAAPEIVANPTDVSAFPGESAVYTSSFTSTSAIVSNKWYKAGEPATELVPGANVMISQTYDSINDVYTSTLTLSNLATANDGQYYCAFGNTGGTTNSASAKLIIKRLIAQWQFEGDALDVAGIYNGTLTGTPVFETIGKVGQAIIFDGVDDYIDLPDGFSDFSAGMTVTVWSNPSVATNWGRFIDFGNGAGGVNILFTRNGTTNTLRFDTDEGFVDAENAFTQNEWQMFVVSMTETGEVTLYKNGLPIQTGTVGLPGVVTRTINYIGESNWTSDSLYAGMMDDMRIYNYGITADQVADLYSGVVGTYCRNRPTYDFNSDCQVMLEDFAYLAGYWLDCGFYPVTDCQ
ncbi:MAG: LamG-like jellyroll fold domain-containing protein [Anaerohalosphaeraceae bacterium]